MAEQILAKRGETFVHYTSLIDANDGNRLKSAPTLASGDVKVRKDDGSEANITTLPTASGTIVKVSLSASETGADYTLVIFSDQTDPPEWADRLVVIPTATRKLEDLAHPATSGRSLLVDASGNVTVGTNNDKTGYSISQTFPTNFADLAITASTGLVTIGTNNDKTGYSLSQSFPNNFADLEIASGTGTITVGNNVTVGDVALAALAKFATQDTGETLAVDGSVSKLSQGSAGSSTITDISAAALAKFLTQDTGETTAVDGSVGKIAQGSAGGNVTVSSLTASALGAIRDELTSVSAAITPALSGSDVTITRGDTISIPFGIDLSSYSKVWFTVKTNQRDSDADARLQIEKSVGLLRVNGGASTAGDGDITDAGTVTLKANQSAKLVATSGRIYDLQALDGSGNVSTLRSGSFHINSDVTLTQA